MLTQNLAPESEPDMDPDACRTELDYGNLVCRAINSVGVQLEACIFHLIPAGLSSKLLYVQEVLIHVIYQLLYKMSQDFLGL